MDKVTGQCPPDYERVARVAERLRKGLCHSHHLSDVDELRMH